MKGKEPNILTITEADIAIGAGVTKVIDLTTRYPDYKTSLPFDMISVQVDRRAKITLNDDKTIELIAKGTQTKQYPIWKLKIENKDGVTALAYSITLTQTGVD